MILNIYVNNYKMEKKKDISVSSKDKEPIVKNIDEKHTDIMNTFYVIENNTIPGLQQEKQLLKKKIKYFETHEQQHTDEFFETIDKIVEIREKIRDLRQQKKKIFIR
jgi:hypothetical protein